MKHDRSLRQANRPIKVVQGIPLFDIAARWFGLGLSGFVVKAEYSDWARASDAKKVQTRRYEFESKSSAISILNMPINA